MKGFDPLQMLTTVYILLSNSISIAVLLYEVSSCFALSQYTHSPTSAPNTLTHPPDTQQYPDVLIYIFLFIDLNEFESLTSFTYVSNLVSRFKFHLKWLVKCCFSFLCVTYFLWGGGKGEHQLVTGFYRWPISLKLHHRHKPWCATSC